MKNIAFATLLALCVASGCIVETPEPPGRLGMIFDDIPVPRGFAMDRDLTYGHVFPAFRVYSQVFKGTGSVESTADFYKTNMGRHRWQLLSADEADKSKITLQYANDTEVCCVRVYEDAPSTRDPYPLITVVKIDVTKK